MALTGCASTTDIYSGVVSPGASPTAGCLLFSCRYKRATGISIGSTTMFRFRETTGTSPGLRFGRDASDKLLLLHTGAGGATTINDASAGSLSNDVWQLIVALLEGPHDGSSRAYETWLDGVLLDSGTYTSTTLSNTWDTMYIGVTADPTDKFAYACVGSYASLAAAQAAGAALLAGPPSGVSGIVNAWDLISDAVASVGATNLTVTGAPTFDGDAPTFAGGGVIPIYVSSCTM